MKLKAGLFLSVAAVAVAAWLGAPARVGAQQGAPAAVTIGASDLGGVVRSASGPEAGVWVIAETTDLPTKFAKMVVTDDQGRYVLPELPAASYEVWVRGYGLVDSPKVQAKPGTTLNLTAVAGAERGGSGGILSRDLLVLDAACAGQGPIPRHRPERQRHFDQCPQPGDVARRPQDQRLLRLSSDGQQGDAHDPEGARPIRTPPIRPGSGASSPGRRATPWPAPLGRYDTQGSLKGFADWTDRIAAGELPSAKPERPQGIERNIVVSCGIGAAPRSYLHDEIATDRRNPTVNANGPLFGTPE